MPNSETYPQSSIDSVTTELSYLQETHDWHSNVNKTYNLALIPEGDSERVRHFPASGSFTGTGRLGYYTQWRTDNPNAIAYVDGTDANESLNYNVWNELVNGVVHATNGTCKPTSTQLSNIQSKIDEMTTLIAYMTDNVIS
jgi:hypothetical protein